MRYVLAPLALLLVALAYGCGASLDASLTDFEPGDCVVNPGIGEYTELERVECSESGAVRVVGKFDIEGHTTDYPGELAIDDEASARCPVTMEWYLVPTEESWEQADDRLVVCFQDVN